MAEQQPLYSGRVERLFFYIWGGFHLYIILIQTACMLTPALGDMRYTSYIPSERGLNMMTVLTVLLGLAAAVLLIYYIYILMTGDGQV